MFKGIGRGRGQDHRPPAAALTPITVTTAPVVAVDGAGVVTLTPGVYGQAIAVNNRFIVISGVRSAWTGAATIQPGQNVLIEENPSAAGFVGISVQSNLALRPAASDLIPGDWTSAEAAADEDTRKTRVVISKAQNAANLVWRISRGTGSAGLAAVSAAEPDLAFLGVPTETAPGSNVWSWLSSGLTPINEDTAARSSHVRIAELNTDTNTARWVSEVKTFVGSMTPAAPVGVVITQGATNNSINVSLPTVGDGRGRPILAPYAAVDGAAPVALTPAGGVTGQRIFTVAGFTPVSVEILWLNANGFSVPTAATVVTPGTEAALAPIVMQSSFALTPNVTVTFRSGPLANDPLVQVQTVTDALGKTAIIKQAGVYARFTPASAGEADGVMANPNRYVLAAAEQGFSRLLETTLTIKPTQRSVYNPSLNAEVVGGGAVSVANQISYVKFVPRPGAFGDSGNALEYAILTVLDTRPATGFFRPGTMRAEKPVVALVSQVQAGVLQTYPDVAGQITLAEAETKIPEFRFSNGYGGEILRSLSNDRAGGTTTYMSTAGVAAAHAYLRLHIGPNDATKQTLRNRIIALGLDCYDAYLAGWRGRSGAGQFQKDLEAMVMAGFALQRADILAAAAEVRQNIVGQTMFVKPAHLGYSPGWPTGGGANTNQRRYNPSIKAIHVDQPYLFQQSKVDLPTSCLSVVQRYLPVSTAAAIQGLLFILMLRNGPGGISGLTWWLNSHGGNGAMDITNDKVAAIWWLDRWMAGPPDAAIPAWVRSLYAAQRATIAIPVYSGPALTYELASTNYAAVLTATADGFSYNFAGVNWSTGAKTADHLIFSQDGIQFINVPGTAEAGSVAAIPGFPAVKLTAQKHYVRRAMTNTAPNGQSYMSEFSPNHSFTDDPSFTGERMIVTPNGARTNHAPVFVVPPKIYLPVNPTTTEKAYTEAPSQLPAGINTIVAGCGYVDSHPAATLTYQLRVNGVLQGTPVSSPTMLRNRTVGATDDVTIRVFANNGIDAPVFADTNVVRFAPIAVYPDTTLLDTKWDGAVEVEWPAVLDSVLTATAVGGTLVWSPYEVNGVEPAGDLENTELEIRQTSIGAVKLVKNGTNPRLPVHLTAARKMVIGEKYRLELEIPVSVPNPWTLTPVLSIGSTAGGNQYASLRMDAYPQPRIHQFVLEFTATSTELYFDLLISTSTGGTVGGDLELTYTKLTRLVDFTPGGVGYPAPYPTPVVIFDTNVDGFVLGGWITAGSITVAADGLVLDSGAAWPSIARVFNDNRLTVGRQMRITATVRRLTGSALCRFNIGRPAYTDPDYGAQAEVVGMYASEVGYAAPAETKVLLDRVQSTPGVRYGMVARANTGGWKLERLLIEAL